MSTETPTSKKPAGPRLQHVVAHENEHVEGVYDEVLVFGQEIDALRHLLSKTGWVYAAVPHGRSFADALKAAASS